MSDGRQIMWVTRDGAEPVNFHPDVGKLLNYSIAFCSVDALNEEITAAQPGPPAAVVVDPGLRSPLRVARQVYRLTPLSHIVFPTPQERLGEMRRQMSIAPMIGTNWTIVDPAPSLLTPALEAAVRASAQRRQLRTSLDAVNLHLRQERPPQDSAEYRKLVISDRYLATILEHAQDAIVSLDPQRRIATWNRGAVEMFGYDAEETPRLRLDNLVIPEQREEVLAWFARARGGEAVVQREACFGKANGTTFITESTFAPVRDEVGEVIAVSLTAHDITERKRGEEELRRMHAQLEERVAERTAALEAVNRELEAFTYSASHDLRAPLRGIDGFSQALLEDYADTLDAQAVSYVRRIRNGARRMGEIIDSLLMLSRISRADLQLERFDLGEIVARVVAELRETEPDRSVEVKVEPNLVVTADQQLLLVGLGNLINNAWKFTREREDACIEVGHLQGRPVPTYFVRDNGAGFDMAYADKLFIPFQRLHDPERFEGSGIGLGTVQRVIGRHGGRVWAQGEPGKGATFYFELPEVS